MTEELLKYFNNDEMAAGVWLGKYAQEGEVTPDDMHRRMAKEFARVEFKYTSTTEVNGAKDLSEYGQKYWEELGDLNQEQISQRIYNLFKDFKYIVPQGSIMYGLGRGIPVSLSNCFVIDSAKDSYGGIMLTDQEQAQLMKRRKQPTAS